MDTRRQFLGTAAAALAAGPLVASQRFPRASNADTTVFPDPGEFCEPPLPPGVCRQFGSARFRDLSGARGQFSADSRWLVNIARKKCVGHHLGSGQAVRFDIPASADWTEMFWLVTTDARLIVVERNKTDDSRVRRFELPGGVELPPREVSGRVRAVSADGRVAVADADKNGVVVTWAEDLDTGKPRWGPTPLQYVSTLEPTGRLATVGIHIGDPAPDFVLKFLDAHSGRTTPIEPPGLRAFDLYHAWCAADANRVVGHVVSLKGEVRRVCAWDTRTGKLEGAFEIGEKERVIGPTADGKGVFAVVGDDRRLVVRGISNGQVVRELPVTDVSAAGTAVTPDGKVLLVARPPEHRSPIRLLDADTGRPLPQCPDPSGEFERVWFPGPHTVGATHRTTPTHADAHVWDMTTGRRTRVVDPRERNLSAAFGESDPVHVISPTGEHILQWVIKELHVLDSRTHRASGKMEHGAPFPCWLNADTVGMCAMTEVVVWDVPTGRMKRTPLNGIEQDNGPVSAVRSADGRVFAFRTNTEKLTIGWADVNTGSCRVVREPKLDPRYTLQMSADGQRIGVKLLERIVRHEFDSFAEQIDSFVVYTRDGRRFRLKADAGYETHSLNGCGRTVVAQRPKDTEVFGPVPRGPAVELWEVESGQLRWAYPLDFPVSDLRASPCGRYFATVRADTPVYLWDIYGEKSDQRPTPTHADLPKLWAELNASDAERAFSAVRTLIQHPTAAAQVLGANLKPAEVPKPGWVAAKIDQLSDGDFHRRQAAERELAAVADVVAAEVKKAADAGGATPEADERLTRLAARANRPTDLLRIVRAVEVLEYAEGKAAAELLAKLADGAAGAVLTREATAALYRRRWRADAGC